MNESGGAIAVKIGPYTIGAQELSHRDAIRWAVGQAGGRRSATWRLWGDKKGDAYLSMRSLGSQLKASFHRDRRCSFGFTKRAEVVASERFGLDSRHMKRWTLPEGQLVRAAQILIPEAELAVFSAKESEAMRWIPSPAKERVTVVSIFIAEPPTAFDWRGPENSGGLIGAMNCQTRFTWAVHWEQDLDEATALFIAGQRERARASANSKSKLEQDSRVVLCGYNDERGAFFIELSAVRV
jgi:hypothetical protein